MAENKAKDLAGNEAIAQAKNIRMTAMKVRRVVDMVRGRGPFVAFAAAKAGLRSVAQSFAREYGPQGVHVAHIIIDGGIDGEQLRRNAPERARDAAADHLLRPDAIAETYWQLHRQQRSAWTHELDLRPYREPF